MLEKTKITLALFDMKVSASGANSYRVMLVTRCGAQIAVSHSDSLQLEAIKVSIHEHQTVAYSGCGGRTSMIDISGAGVNTNSHR